MRTGIVLLIVLSAFGVGILLAPRRRRPFGEVPPPWVIEELKRREYEIKDDRPRVGVELPVPQDPETEEDPETSVDVG